MSNMPPTMQESELDTALLMEKVKLSYDSDFYPSHIEDAVFVVAFALAKENDYLFSFVHQQELVLFNVYSKILPEVSNEMIVYFLTLVKESSELHNWLSIQTEEIDKQQLLVGLGALLAQTK
jgi:hypothetical protein